MKIYSEPEIWLPVTISGFSEIYSVSNLGRLRSIGFSYIDKAGRKWSKNPRVVKRRIQKRYCKTVLHLNKKKYYFQLHQLIALAFIPNPENKPFINHIDGNPLNNRIENLEWCTQSENMSHSYYTLKKQYNKNMPVIQMSKDGIYINRFNGVNEAGKSLGKGNSAIWRAVKGLAKTAYGYKWKYE